MTLSPTRGRARWRRGENCSNDLIRRQEEENETFCERSFLLDDALLDLQAEIERWESHVSRYEKLKDKMDDEIKLAGLEALKSLANFRGCAAGDRDVRGGEIWFKDP